MKKVLDKFENRETWVLLSGIVVPIIGFLGVFTNVSDIDVHSIQGHLVTVGPMLYGFFALFFGGKAQVERAAQRIEEKKLNIDPPQIESEEL